MGLRSHLRDAETQIKASLLTHRSPLFSARISFVDPQEGCVLHGLHVARMARSAAYFDIDFDQSQAEALIDQVTGEMPLKVRLLLHQHGQLDLSARRFALIKCSDVAD